MVLKFDLFLFCTSFVFFRLISFVYKLIMVVKPAQGRLKLLRSWHFSREVDDPVSRGVPSTLDLEIQWFAGGFGLCAKASEPQSEKQAWDWDLGLCLRILWKGPL